MAISGALCSIGRSNIPRERIFVTTKSALTCFPSSFREPSNRVPSALHRTIFSIPCISTIMIGISDAEGHLFGEFHLKLTARDMAKIGALFLQHGRWGDKQIVSEVFVTESTTKQNDGGPPVNAGYGYLWWIARTKTNLAAFFAAGYGGQAIYAVPKLNVAIAVKADNIPGGSQNFIN